MLALRRNVIALCIGAALAGTMACAGAHATAPNRFDEAMLEYEAGHYAQAYASWAALADQGHAEAARLAWQMWRHGPKLYGQTFAAERAQLERWQALHQCARNDLAVRCTLISGVP
jgi:hypothetical protein